MSGETARESFYAIRRTDGEMVYDEFAWVGCSGPDDWTVAIECDLDDATEYEIVRMLVEPVARRTFPECGEGNCTVPAAYWGLCETHAREDDPSAFDDAPAPPVSSVLPVGQVNP